MVLDTDYHYIWSFKVNLEMRTAPNLGHLGHPHLGSQCSPGPTQTPKFVDGQVLCTCIEPTDFPLYTWNQLKITYNI